MSIVYFYNKDINSKLLDTSKYKKISEKRFIYFSRFELSLILNLYSQQVSKGLWRDYALDYNNDLAIFSIYRHSHDKPLYQIVKKSIRGFRNKPEFYIKNDIQIMNKSNELTNILSKFEKKLSIKNTGKI